MDKTNHKKVGNCVSPNCLHHCHGVGGWEAGTLIGVKNYKSLVKSGQNVHCHVAYAGYMLSDIGSVA